MAENVIHWALYEAETISRARAGDSDAGIEALRICVAGLVSNTLSEPMRFYLSQCLLDLADGMKAERAMNIEVERGGGRPTSADASSRDMLLAVWVTFAIGRGLPASEAKAEAGDFWNVANVNRAMRGVEVTALDDDSGLWDRLFEGLGKPLPPRH